jgi:hypothetical protein
MPKSQPHQTETSNNKAAGTLSNLGIPPPNNETTPEEKHKYKEKLEIVLMLQDLKRDRGDSKRDADESRENTDGLRRSTDELRTDRDELRSYNELKRETDELKKDTNRLEAIISELEKDSAEWKALNDGVWRCRT